MKRCVQYKEGQNQGQQGQSGQISRGCQGLAAQNAQVEEYNPNIQDNNLVNGGYNDVMEDWGWASGSGVGSGVTEGNSVSASYSDLSDIQPHES